MTEVEYFGFEDNDVYHEIPFMIRQRYGSNIPKIKGFILITEE